MATTDIRLLIFDLGGVLIHLEFDRLLTRWGIPHEHRAEFNKNFMNWHVHHDFEKGLISEAEFFTALEKYLQNAVTNAVNPAIPSMITKHNINGVQTKASTNSTHEKKLEQDLIDSWNSLLGAPVTGASELIQQVLPSTQVHLLSNTNQTHIQYCKDHNYPFLQDLHHCWFSYDLGARKPNLDIYELVTKKTQIPESQILFIDDNLDNVTTAKKHGWHSEQGAPSVVRLEEILKKYHLVD
jgi:putative hydrolase of the HAD superfamily